MPAEERYRPLYARLLGLRFVNPGGVLCFLFFEGAVALAVLLALAELVNWWAVLVLPVAVAVMVKLNDMVAERGGPLGRAGAGAGTGPVSPADGAGGRPSPGAAHPARRDGHHRSRPVGAG